MVRAQILLEPEQHEFLKELSQRTGDSLSELVRRAVDAMRAQVSSPDGRLLLALGAHRADRPDVSVRHDHYLTSVEK
jgi:hypothetical protein